MVIKRKMNQNSNNQPLWVIMSNKLDPHRKKLVQLLENLNYKIDYAPTVPMVLEIPPKMGILYLIAEDFNEFNLSDFLTTIIEPFIQNYFSHIIIIENFSHFKEKKQEALVELSLVLFSKYQTGFISTRNFQDTAICLQSLAKREQILDIPPLISRVKKKSKTLLDSKKNVLQGLLNCGDIKIKILLNHFNSLKEIINAIVNEPEKISNLPHFGDKFITENRDLLTKYIPKKKVNDIS